MSNRIQPTLEENAKVDTIPKRVTGIAGFHNEHLKKSERFVMKPKIKP